MDTPKFNTWHDYFNWLEELAFRMYENPALPGGDLGMFPAAYPCPELCECGCEVAPDGSHAPACCCCECCGEYPCQYPVMDDDGDDTVIDTRWYGWLKK